MKKKVKFIIPVILVLAVVMTLGVIYILSNTDIVNNPKSPKTTGKVDDWVYEPKDYNYETSGFKGGVNFSGSLDSMATTESAADLGFTTGGAQNAENYRENIENGYFPLMSDITYNGLFSEYYFDTGKENSTANTEDMFYPTYSAAVSKDPISGEEEYYLSVGLNSNIKEEDFSRKNLNLVLVLDISGSMESSFNDYYYDFNSSDEEYKSKMQVAKESINMLIDRLGENDSLGVVLFESDSQIAKELNLNSNTDLDAIKEHVLEIESLGGTNFEAGYKDASKLFEDYSLANNEEYENRIIVLTDAMPNIGNTSDEGLLGMVKENSEKGIYTTFIGIGVDFNTELIEEITDVKGSNYYSVHNEDEFNKKMDEEFEYMVTPLVFDLSLNLESEDFEIAEVYGSDTKNDGEIMKVNTLFPSKSEGGETKGGIVLLKLNKKSEDSNKITLKVSYTDREGNSHSNEQNIEIDKTEEEFYDNTGIRKGIVLSRYVTTLRKWIAYERTEDDKFIIVPTIGIDCFEEEYYISLGEQERTSVDLTVSDEYKDVFKSLKEYVEKENEVLKDETLEKELEILENLINL